MLGQQGGDEAALLLHITLHRGFLCNCRHEALLLLKHQIEVGYHRLEVRSILLVLTAARRLAHLFYQTLQQR